MSRSRLDVCVQPYDELVPPVSGKRAAEQTIDRDTNGDRLEGIACCPAPSGSEILYVDIESFVLQPLAGTGNTTIPRKPLTRRTENFPLRVNSSPNSMHVDIYPSLRSSKPSSNDSGRFHVRSFACYEKVQPTREYTKNRGFCQSSTFAFP